MAEPGRPTMPTLLFSDIEGSTSLLQRVGPRYADLLSRHRVLVRDAVAEFRGLERGTEGDSFFVTFDTPIDALGAAVAIQRAHATERWPEDAPIRVRMGVHRGEASETSAGLVGLAIHHAARIASSAHGGQIVISGPVHDELGWLPVSVGMRSLGVHELRDVGEVALFQVTHPEIEADFPPLRAQGASRNNLPAALTTLVGRRRELQAVAELLGRHRLVTLTGAGGSGKTRLSLQAASEAGARFVDGVWLMELAAVTDGSQIMPTVGEAIGVRGDDAAIIEAIRHQAMLFVLDNCEHVLDESSSVASRLLAASSKSAVLATSREPLGLAGEAVFRVPSLSLPSVSCRPHELIESEAGLLFVERARLVRPDLVVDDADALAISDICRRLDGIPLAIELAAARVRVLSPHDIARRLDDRFRLLTGGSRSALPRQQTLQATVDWSFRLLSVQEQMMLVRLAVFHAGCDLMAAESVCATDDMDELDVLDIMSSLQDKSLVVSAETPTRRYWMGETIRQYAADRFVNSDDVTTVRDRHAHHFVTSVDQALSNTARGAITELAGLCDAEGDNLSAAATWLLERDPERALHLLCQLNTAATFWHGMDWVAMLTPLALERSVDAGAELRAVAHVNIASSALFAYLEADVDGHRALALELLPQVSDRSWFAHVLGTLTFQAAMMEQTLDVDGVLASCAAADDGGTFGTRIFVRKALLNVAPVELAMPMIQTIIDIAQALAAPSLEQEMRLELAVRLGFAGRTEEAFDLITAGLLDVDQLTATGDAFQTALFVALLEAEHGDLSAGLHLAEDLAERLLARTHGLSEQVDSLATIAWLRLLDGDVERAEDGARKALELYGDQPESFLSTLARLTLSACLRSRGDYAQAIEALGRHGGDVTHGMSDRAVRMLEEAALLCHAIGRAQDAADLLATAASRRVARAMPVSPARQPELTELGSALGHLTGVVLDSRDAVAVIDSLAPE